MHHNNQLSLGRLKTQGKQPKRSGFAARHWLTGILVWSCLALPGLVQAVVTYPSAPSITSITPGNGQLSVAFTLASNGGATVNYWYSFDGGNSFTTRAPASSASPLVITGLTNGTSYNISIAARNSRGTGPWSSAVSGTPVAQVPSAPTSLSATAGNGQASISFTAGANNGSAITNYQYSTDNGTSFIAFSPAQTSSPVTIIGLTNGTAYNIKLKGVNAIGTSTASSAVSVTPATTPSAPTSLSATAGNGQASISFTAGANNGSAITNYQYSTDGGTSFSAFSPAKTSSPVTIAGLTKGTAYSIALKAVNAAGAGTASSTVSVTPYGDCGPGVSLTTGTAGVGSLWQMMALPCVPATGTIAGVFGSGTLSNLTTINYATDQTNLAAAEKNGWIIEKKTVGATPAYEPLLSADLALSVGTGYWIKSYQAPTNGLLSMDGTATPTDVSQAEGCYSVNGCKAITVTTYKATYNRYNLVGNPFPYAIDWTKVRVRVDGSPTTYTPAQAAGVAVGDPLNRATPVISNVVNIWNATSTGYDVFTDVAPYPSTPNLQYFKSFWVNVLPGAFGHTVELLIPAEQSTLSLNTTVAPVSTGSIEQVAKLDLPWYLAWLDVVVSPAYAAPAVSNHVKPQMLANANDWYIRLKVDNPVTGWSDHNSLLGELMDANIGFDPHDVQEMAPYAAPYLTLVFPKPEWDVNAGDYASDFHRFNLKVQTWNFEVRAKPIGSKVFLSWEGSPALLKRSRLIEIATGKIILPSDPRWKAKGYPIKLTNAVQKYTWKVLTP